MFTFETPLFFAETVTFKDSGGQVLDFEIEAGIITGSALFRDPSTDIAFIVNTGIDTTTDSWGGQVGTIRISWLKMPNVTYHVYSVIPDGTQYIFFCAPEGAASLTPPVAGVASGGQWTTATRPTPGANDRPIGFNLTTNKHEGWNGTTWNNFY